MDSSSPVTATADHKPQALSLKKKAYMTKRKCTYILLKKKDYIHMFSTPSWVQPNSAADDGICIHNVCTQKHLLQDSVCYENTREQIYLDRTKCKSI